MPTPHHHRPQCIRGSAGSLMKGPANLREPAVSDMSVRVAKVSTLGPSASEKVRNRPTMKKGDDSGEGGKNDAVPK